MPGRAVYLAAYGGFSVSAFAVSLVTSARKSIDYLTLMQELTDGFNLFILLNFVVSCFVFSNIVSIRVLFGDLRIIEYEHLVDRLPYYGLSLLFIIFNDENLLLNVVWTGLIVASKVHHIIVYDRIDFLQLKVVNALGSHSMTKMEVVWKFVGNIHIALLTLFILGDLVMAKLLAYDVFQGVSSMGSLLFGIHFGVMGIDGITYWGKMLLNAYELVFYRSQPSTEQANGLSDDEDDEVGELVWEDKAFYTQLFEIGCSTLKAVFYAVFLYMLFYHSSLALPIPLIQGSIVSIHSAFKKIIQFKNFLAQSRNLDKLLDNATKDELSAADLICIICREDMFTPEEYQQQRGKPLSSRKCPKKLKCGHVLHLGCLNDWIERSDNCPLCRQKVFGAPEPPAPTPVARPQPPVETPGIHTPTPATTTATARAETPVQQEREPTPEPTPGPTHYEANRRTFPADWIALPIKRSRIPGQFTVTISPTQQATLRVRPAREDNVDV